MNNAAATNPELLRIRRDGAMCGDVICSDAAQQGVMRWNLDGEFVIYSLIVVY